MNQPIEHNVPEFLAPYFQHYQFKGLYGGRGSGKSHGFATIMIRRAALEPNFRGLCVREIQSSIAESSKQILEDKIKALGLSVYFEITDSEIRGRFNGSKIIFRGMQSHTAKSIKSLEGINVAWIEEAETLSEISLNALIPTIRAPGSEIWASWNPGKPEDPIDKLFRENKDDPNFLVKQVSWRDNHWFPPELKRILERDKARDIDKYNHVWEGSYWGVTEAQIFKNYSIDVRQIPISCQPLYGIDWGYAADPTTAVQCWLIDDTTLYVDQEVYEHAVPMDQLPTVLGRITRMKNHVIYADVARPETIDYVRRRGFPKLRGARKGPGSVQDGISQLQGYDIVVHPDCVNLIRELKSYSWKKDRAGVIHSDPVDANNDLIDALRYAVREVERKAHLQELMARNASKTDFTPVRPIADEWKVV